ncbi:MAG: L-serine ammonia-lyase, iron-sulfur-dependent, subunit alpha [Lachnospiraceae bacterium]|nr:L-serine ammonia-lyase, iron-sulfur-dependent, subunit alpha [Lachnospiraceae bacterium]
MKKTDLCYQTYVDILHRELVCAMGCTEPIAVAFCAAKATTLLANVPDKVIIEASGNIIKNVKSVIVPNTGGRKGLETAAAIGIIAGDASKELEVISSVSEMDKIKLAEFMDSASFSVKPLISDQLLDLIIHVWAGEESASVRISNEHTNIVEMKKNGSIIYKKEHDSVEPAKKEIPLDYSLLSVEKIYDFATTCNLDDVRELLNRQISCNMNIAKEGLMHSYGANIGKVLLNAGGYSLRAKAKAYAAAGSDARMSGCEMPVVINSGSGNQGMTASLPVIVYAREMLVSEDRLLRGLLISNLITIHEKTSIGRLSAYCGAVSAGAGAGAGIAYVCGGNLDDIAHTIVNALAITSGIVCDGAKASCAAKIAMSVEAGILGYEMFKNGQQFYAGDGLVMKGVENSIKNFGHLGSVAMATTNEEIIRMMTKGDC